MKTARSDRFKAAAPLKKTSRKKSTSRSKTLPPTHYELFKDFIGIVKDMPPDVAKNHDHYAHGAPKRFK